MSLLRLTAEQRALLDADLAEADRIMRRMLADCPRCGEHAEKHFYDALAPEHCVACAPSSCGTCLLRRQLHDRWTR